VRCYYCSIGLRRTTVFAGCLMQKRFAVPTMAPNSVPTTARAPRKYERAKSENGCASVVEDQRVCVSQDFPGSGELPVVGRLAVASSGVARPVSGRTATTGVNATSGLDASGGSVVACKKPGITTLTSRDLADVSSCPSCKPSMYTDREAFRDLSISHVGCSGEPKCHAMSMSRMPMSQQSLVTTDAQL